MKSLLSKLNKDELILIIENIEAKHKKEILENVGEVEDYYLDIISHCLKLGNLEFRKCSVDDCKAVKIMKSNNPDRFYDICCKKISKCLTCRTSVCDSHKCKCNP